MMNARATPQPGMAVDQFRRHLEVCHLSHILVTRGLCIIGAPGLLQGSASRRIHTPGGAIVRDQRSQSHGDIPSIHAGFLGPVQREAGDILLVHVLSN